MKSIFLTGFFFLFATVRFCMGNPVAELLERIDKGASNKFVIERRAGDTDFFELDQKGDKVVVRGNNYVSIANGINWYLKYHAGIHLSWNNMHHSLPAILPRVPVKERHESSVSFRYNLNYCTFSYSMAFWDWERWQKEIDWMALHGINLSLAITGTETVWYNVLQKLNYSTDEINEFIAGPGFQAWWLMNNLEGWGGPNPEGWYEGQATLQQKILARMRELEIEPVLVGYAGMVPSNAKEKLNLTVADPGLWCGYRRPAFLQPEDPRFEEIASLYYDELTRLYGKARFYSIDPFHEGGNTEGVNLDVAGKKIMHVMKQVNPDAVWVIQAWQKNPKPEMIDNLNAGDLLVLDLFSESRPQWGDSESTWYREKGYGKHDWVYCMLLNFGANVGLHGKFDTVINSFYTAKKDPHAGKTLKGVGMTEEGIENNPVMFELVMELPWRAQPFTKEEFLKGYVFARYGEADPILEEVWKKLANSIYNCPKNSTQQGTHESVFCARPSENTYQASSWSEMTDYYDPAQVIEAARMMLLVADKYRNNNNYEYDLVDILRQAIAEKGRMLQKEVIQAYQRQDSVLFTKLSLQFLQLIVCQDRLLGTRSEFQVGSWINPARKLGKTPADKKLLEWNARVQIVTWGNRQAADVGGLRDYAHKEWNGILKDLYYKRWEAYFNMLRQKLAGFTPGPIDFYAMEEQWVNDSAYYSDTPQESVIDVARTMYNSVFNESRNQVNQ